MLLFVLLKLLIKVAVAQERDPYCQAPSPPLPLPDCTDQCLIGRNKALDANCADNLEGFCRLDIVALHFKEYGKCILNACPSKADRQDYVNLFQDECAREKRPFNNDKVPGVFNYEDLLSRTPSSSPATSSDSASSEATSRSISTAGDTPFVTSISPVTTTEAAMEPPIDISSSEPDEPAKTSQPPPPITFNPVAAPSPTRASDESPSVIDSRPQPSDSYHNGSKPQERDDVTPHIHTMVATTVNTVPNSTSSHEAEPAFGTPAIVGTAAGGTAGIALIIGAIYLFMQRRKRRASLASSRDIWSPTRNTQDKPELDGYTAFGRYSDTKAATPIRQRSKAELHSENIPSLPVLLPQQDPFSNVELEAGAGPGSTNSRYYHSNQQRPQPQPHHQQPNNMDSCYPDMRSYTSPTMTSPMSPVSATSTMQGWQLTPLTSALAITPSHAEPSSETARSPVVSELESKGARPLRATRSAELHGAEGMEGLSELARDERVAGGGSGAVELHNESARPTEFGEGKSVGAKEGAVEMDGEGLQRQDRVGCGY